MVAKKMNARVVLNRANADKLRLGVADGLLAFGNAIIAAAHPPDATPFGEGLVTAGGVVVFIDGKKVGGDAQKPSQEQGLKAKGIVGFVGYGFPARFQEIGTIHQPARPFATPAVHQTIPQGESIMAPPIRARMKSA